MSLNLSVYDPTAPVRNDEQQKRRTLDSLQGKIVGFIDNSKPNFNFLCDDIGTELESRYGVKSLVKHRKRTASVAATDAAIKEMASQCDVIITGSGD